ncbi:MAG: glycerol-3-phosphate dehydrogenase, partial [Clostridia bacterium]|nr:glycerol-3-phosphate dehydrogenase [Clostridia bacterium]
MSVITIVGSGMMGSAIGIPAACNGHEVRMVGTPLDREIISEARKTGYHITLKRQLPDSYKYYQFEEVDQALRGADLLVGGVSSFGIDWFCENVLKVIDPALPILTVTKGMMDDENGDLHVYPEIFEKQSGSRGLKLNAVGGPCTSYELADRDNSEVTFCGKDMALLRWIRSLFECDFYHVSLSTDVVGVEAAVAMKNAYALGVTLAVGLAEKRDGKIGALHFNSQAALFGQSAKEMEKLLAYMGARKDSLMLGIGDLYVTVYGGRTRMIGTLLGRGMNIDQALAELKGVTLESVVIATRSAR